jgi:hypothetical protein
MTLQVSWIFEGLDFRSAAGPEVLPARLDHFQDGVQDQGDLLQLQQHPAPVSS